LGFRQLFQLRCDLADIPGVIDRAVAVRHDRNRYAHHGKLFMLPFSVDGIDVALQPVVAIVKIRYHQIEPFNHCFANYADVIGVAHKDKIIAARMADEPLYPGKLTDECREN